MRKLLALLLLAGCASPEAVKPEAPVKLSYSSERPGGSGDDPVERPRDLTGRSVKTRGPRPEQARDQQRGWLLLAEGKRERLGPAFRALQDGRPEVKRGASGVESESLRDTAAMRPHRGLMRHRRESFSTGATATDSPLDGATRRAR